MRGFPDGWTHTTVGEAGNLQLGRQRHPDWHQGPEMRPYLRVANVFEDRIDTSDVKQMDFSGCFAKYSLKPGDVLLCEGQSPQFLGRPAIYRGNPPEAAFTNSLIRFQPGPMVISEWALLVFRHYMHSGRFMRESRITTNIAHLSLSRLRDVEFPTPPLEVQRRIVDLLEEHLSRLDAGVSCLSRVEARGAVLTREALRSATRAVPTETRTLDAVVSRVEAGKSFSCLPRPAVDGEWGVIKVSAMTWGSFRSEENKAVPQGRAIDRRHEIRDGDILVSRANTEEYVGAPVLVSDPPPRLLLSDKSLRLVPAAGVDPQWLISVLQSPETRAQVSAKATGTKESMRNISQKSLLAVHVPVPTNLSDQAPVASLADAARARSDRLSKSVDQCQGRARQLRRALLAAAFDGSLLREPEVAHV